jgi:ribosomal protein S18 acetylase RimI-like enzyme
MIRRALPEDARALARVNRAALAGIASEPPEIGALQAGFAKRIANRNRPLLVAEADGEVKGFVSFGEGEIHALYVDPEAWRRGIGRALLDRALTDMRAAGRQRPPSGRSP